MTNNPLTGIPQRLIPFALALIFIPLLIGDGVVFIDLFVNNAPERAYVEAIIIGVIGVIMLVFSVLTWSRQRPLVIAAYMGGVSLVVGSAICLIFTDYQWLALAAFAVLLAAPFAPRVRQARATNLRQTAIANIDIDPYIALVPTLKGLRQHSLWSHYDPDTDTLVIHFDRARCPQRRN